MSTECVRARVCVSVCVFMKEEERETQKERQGERYQDPFATKFDLSRTSARGRVLSIGINIYEKLLERANENRWAPLNLTKNCSAFVRAQLHKRGIMQFYTMETRNEICNYKRIHRLYPHFASSYCTIHHLHLRMRHRPRYVDVEFASRPRRKKKTFSFDFIKRSEFAKPTILINSELKRNTVSPGGQNVQRGGGDRTKPLRRFWLIFRYFARI